MHLLSRARPWWSAALAGLRSGARAARVRAGLVVESGSPFPVVPPAAGDLHDQLGVDHLHLHRVGVLMGAERAVYVMSIPDGETSTLECSECGVLGMIETVDVTAEQLKHRNYHRELWLAERGQG